jgi:hypothetical protein
MDELPYAVVLYRGEEGEIFMGDDVELLDCPQVPDSFQKMVNPPNERGIGFLGQDLALEYKLEQNEADKDGKSELEGVKNDVLDFGCMVRIGANKLKQNLEKSSNSQTEQENGERKGEQNPLLMIHPHQDPKSEHKNSNFLVSPANKPDFETQEFFQNQLKLQFQNTP